MIETREIRVLVVDDEEVVAAPICDVLRFHGFAVEVAYSGLEAIERVREQRPHCILMDIRMPEMNGIDAFRQIRRLSPDSFVIFMTGYSTSMLIEQAKREGAIEVLSKPLDLPRILRLIKETVATRPVLVVDEDSDFCQSLGDGLAAQGFDVRLVYTVDEALQFFEKEPRRVVILDMKPTGKTGLDALLILHEINPRAIVILMTGFADIEPQMQQGVALSAYSYFLKPFDIDDLVRTIRQAIDLKMPAAPP